MEYLAGSVITLVTMVIVSRLIRKTENISKTVKVNFSQSRKHEITRDYIPFEKKDIKTQSSNHQNSQWTKIVFSGDVAYWIEDNSVYSAKYDDIGIVPETKKIVDMMTIDKVELDKMIFIVDKLTEGNKNDSGNSGK